nr:sensor histidine kinase rcsc [Quercus suber]
MHNGDADFKPELQRLYSTTENNALEALVLLKTRLRTLSNAEFWDAVTEGMSKLLNCELAFVMKRVLVDEQNAVVEMPPLGEPGSCLMASAMHYCSSDGTRQNFNGTKYHAWGCPCAYMRHDKVFLIPQGLGQFITNNPNTLPTPAEAYIAIPLYLQGKCIAHFGVMWSEDGAVNRNLSWAFIEMLMHTLEDMITMRLEEGSDFVRPLPPAREKHRLIPHDAVTIAQSLRPYAGSLSHELRTPMQGVVGMLDVMYATVQEAIACQSDPGLRKIFENLIENIEVVQDSSRRAVEAADNVVHAYDMNMSVPESTNILTEESMEPLSPSSIAPERRPDIVVVGSNLPMARSTKRRREDGPSRHNSSSSAKMQKLEGASTVWSRCSDPGLDVIESREGTEHLHTVEVQQDPEPPVLIHRPARMIAPGLRHTSMREVIRHVINEGLKVGGRPDSTLARETEFGEWIEVRSRGSDGTSHAKIIEWSVDPNVPSTMFIDEKDLHKLVSCVFLNAIKFTDHTAGRIGLHAKMSSRSKYVSIRIADNGPGIPASFLPRLFKAFSQEDGSLTRQSEGLGLGLMVAKGIARKLGGDLMCIRAETEGPNHGSEFEVKVPVKAGDIISRPPSPFASPTPQAAELAPADTPQLGSKHLPPIPESFSSTHDATCTSCMDIMATTSTPVSPRSRPIYYISPSPREPTKPSTKSLGSSNPVATPANTPDLDRDLARKYPLNFLVADDNKILRRLLVSMLGKFGYKNVLEAHDGAEAVRQMSVPRWPSAQIDVVLMDLWMPLMDGYEATERILQMGDGRPTVLAVTADVTDSALERAALVGMKGYLTKPFKLLDLQRLITEYCASGRGETP